MQNFLKFLSGFRQNRLKLAKKKKKIGGLCSERAHFLISAWDEFIFNKQAQLLNGLSAEVWLFIKVLLGPSRAEDSASRSSWKRRGGPPGGPALAPPPSACEPIGARCPDWRPRCPLRGPPSAGAEVGRVDRYGPGWTSAPSTSAIRFPLAALGGRGHGRVPRYDGWRAFSYENTLVSTTSPAHKGSWPEGRAGVPRLPFALRFAQAPPRAPRPPTRLTPAREAEDRKPSRLAPTRRFLGKGHDPRGQLVLSPRSVPPQSCLP